MSHEATDTLQRLGGSSALFRAFEDVEESVQRAKSIAGENLPLRKSPLIRLAARIEDKMPSLPFVAVDGTHPDGRKQRVRITPTVPATDSFCMVVNVGGHGEVISRREGDTVIYDETVVRNVKEAVVSRLAVVMTSYRADWLEDDPRLAVLVASSTDTSAQLVITLSRS